MKISKGEYLIKTRERIFRETFKSAQLLNLTVLYYDFDFSKEELISICNKLIENDSKLDDVNWCIENTFKLEKMLGSPISSIIREFPYRSRIKMMGGIPRGDMQVVNIANESSSKAITSLFLLVVSTMIDEKKWDRNNIETWWQHMKENSENYKKGMTDSFIAEYFKEQIDVEITDTEDNKI